MWGLDYLGLEHGCTEADIKRAYARKLRKVRPDEDAVGFQKLHAAYREALKWLENENRAAGDKSPDTHSRSDFPATGWKETGAENFGASGEVGAHPLYENRVVWRYVQQSQVSGIGMETPAEVGQGHTADSALASLQETLLRIARQEGSTALAHWLQSRQELFDVTLKTQVGGVVLDWLQGETPALPPACIEELFRFFEFEDRVFPEAYLHLQALRKKLEVEWVFSPEYRDGENTKKNGTDKISSIPSGLLKQLNKPFSLSQALITTFPPWRAWRWAKWTGEFCASYDPEIIPKNVYPEQLIYWAGMLGRGRISFPVTVFFFFWAMLLSVACVVVVLILWAFHIFPEMAFFVKSVFRSLGFLFLLLAGLFVGLWSCGDRWVCSGKMPKIVRQSLVPMMCSLAITFRFMFPWISLSVAMMSLSAAVLMYTYRYARAKNPFGIIWVFFCVMLGLLPESFQPNFLPENGLPTLFFGIAALITYGVMIIHPAIFRVSGDVD